MTTMSPVAVGLRECARRVGIPYRTAQRLVAEGRFPVPELPRIGRAHRYSEINIDRYLADAALGDALPARRRRKG